MKKKKGCRTSESDTTIPKVNTYDLFKYSTQQFPSLNGFPFCYNTETYKDQSFFISVSKKMPTAFYSFP